MKADIEQEFLAAYDAYADALYRHCFFRVYSRERADELVQDTFMKTWAYLRQGKKVDNLRAFLYRVANNLVIDHSRKKKDESLEALLEYSPASEPMSDGRQDVATSLMMGEVRRAMETLPEEARLLITLRYIDDLDPQDIGHQLGISANNASVKLNRAIKELRKILET
jgi:RNA polymerase sigma-70 factor (ECF subfamily)